MMVKVMLKGKGMHYVDEGPHKDRSTGMCVSPLTPANLTYFRSSGLNNST